MAKNTIIPYNRRLKEIAQQLRRNATLGEKTLWMLIRKKQLGYEFHRQVPVDNFIVDFYCHELKLAIEIDGPMHESEDVQKEDRNRQTVLEYFGIKFLRFTDETVLGNPEKVVQEIRQFISGKDKDSGYIKSMI